PCRATTAVTPAPASVTVSRWASAGCHPATTPIRASTQASELAKRDVVGDADIGGERGDHRAILLEREVDRPARLRFVRAVSGDREAEVERGVASRLRLAARSHHGNLKRAQHHALLLENHHYVRGAARGRSDEQQLHRR